MKQELQLPAPVKGLVVEEVGDELLIYSNSSQRAFLPNAICGWTFKLCKAGASRLKAVRLLAVERGVGHENAGLLLSHALQELADAGLLEQQIPAQPKVSKTSRRKLLKAAGIGLALLPAVAMVLAPRAATAASTCPSGTCIANPGSATCGACTGKSGIPWTGNNCGGSSKAATLCENAAQNFWQAS